MRVERHDDVSMQIRRVEINIDRYIHVRNRDMHSEIDA